MSDQKTPPDDETPRVEFPVRAPLGEIHIVSPRERRAAEIPTNSGRNPIDELAEFEYAPNTVPADRLPSPGAALRQLCRSIDAHPNLKRLIEDHLAACNSESQGRYRQTEGLKEQLSHAHDEITGLTHDNAALGEESNRLVKKLADLAMDNRRLRAQVDEYKIANERQKQLQAMTSQAFVKHIETELAAENSAPANLDAMGKAARASYLSLSNKPRRWLERIFGKRAPGVWEALPDGERSAWCASALAAALERDMAAGGPPPGQAD